MSVRIAWARSTHPDIASYEVQRATASAGPYTFLVNVPHNLTGVNYDTLAGKFFYVDASGLLSHWYRLVSIDTLANRSLPSAPLEPTSTSPVFSNTVSVDHNYGAPGALRYQTAGGSPVEQALIRVYLKTNFDQGETDQPLAVTMTNAQGNWVTPVTLTTGFTYTLTYAKEGLFGVNRVDILV